MIFNKEELSFLGMYYKCADTKLSQNDKFQISANKETQKVIFSQFSDNATIITKLDKIVDENFTGVYSVGQFASLIQSIPSESAIHIKTDGVYFNDNKYEFEKFNFNDVFNDVDTLLLSMESPQENTIVINDFLKTSKSLMGQGVFDCVALSKGNFVSTMSLDTLTCSYKTSNDVALKMYIPKLAVLLCNEMKLDIVTFNTGKLADKDFNFITIKNTHIIFARRDYDVADIFDEEMVEMYEHKSIVTIKKEVLKEALNRIKVVASKAIHSRIYCSCTNNKFKIESKEQNSSQALELVDAQVDKDLIDNSSFIISQSHLSTIISYFRGENIVIYAPNNFVDGVVIKISDEIGEDFFILNFISE
jgi:hypothetical protein